MNVVAEVMRRSFLRKLEEGGTLLHTSLGTAIRGLVVSGDLMATFGIGDQGQSESVSVTCLAADAVPTGTTIRLEGQHYVVSGRQSRPGAPIVRLHLTLQSGEEEHEP